MFWNWIEVIVAHTANVTIAAEVLVFSKDYLETS